MKCGNPVQMQEHTKNTEPVSLCVRNGNIRSGLDTEGQIGLKNTLTKI